MGWSTIPKVIKSVKIAKNLTKRRQTFETMVEAVNKHTKSKSTKTSKIKRDAVIKGSKIHDKYEKLQKILDKRK
jgi:hypothetical protein